MGLLVAGAVELRIRKRLEPLGVRVAAASEPRRGEELTLDLVPGEGWTPRLPLEVEIVCHEVFDDAQVIEARGLRIERRVSRRRTAHSQTTRVETPGRSATRFRVPSDAPFSYEGECVSFAWRVTVAEDRSGLPWWRKSGAREVPVLVLP